MKNGMYLFAAAVVAGTVGLSSCSNEEDGMGGNGSELTGATTDVTLSLSVKGASKRITGDEANQGATIQEIKNIWVVPMVGDTYQTPISMGNYTPSATLCQKVAKLNETITKFKVYGNVADGFANESAIFNGATFTLQEDADAPGEAGKHAPHALYYYGLAGVTDNTLKGYTAADFTGTETEIAAGTPIGTTYKSIKISKVNYAVGLLAAGVLNGDKVAKFYPTNNNGTLEGTPVAAEEAIEVAGVIINGQYKTLDTDFNKAADSELVPVYETAAVPTFVTTSLDFNDDAKVVGANVYSVVSYTGANESVAMNVVFTLKAGHFIENNAGVILGSADADVPVYLSVTLTHEKAAAANPTYTVFMKDYTTVLNATVKDWGRLSGEEVLSTDVNLGVEIDVDWNKGVVYDEEI